MSSSKKGLLQRVRRILVIPLLLGFWVIGDSNRAGAVNIEEFQLESATVANPSTKPGAPATILQGQADTDDDAGDARDFDWESFFDGSGPTLDGEANTIAINPVLPNGSRANFVISGAAADFMTPDLTGYATGSKDDLPIAGWQCKEPNNLGPKFDLVNAYAVAYRHPTNDHLMVYFASEISSPNGDRNAGFWFLKDSSANCDSAANGGGNTDWTGGHTTGDILVVAAFSGGGDTATVSAFRWVGDDATGVLVPQGTGGSAVVGNECGASPHRDACAVTNEANEVNPPWAAPDADGGNLNANEFVEGGIDLTAITGEQCFATAVANSRSSTTPGSTVHDFVRFSFATCGDLKIVKYVDLNGNGIKDSEDLDGAGGNAPVADPVGRWAFKVFTSGDDPATATPKCAGTTNASGELICAALSPGLYDVYETQVANSATPPVLQYYNTQAGTTVAVNKGASPSFTVNLAPAGTTVTFGNICYVDKTFRINNVPTGSAAPTSITVEYSVNDGAPATKALAVTGTATIWEGAVNDTFLQTDTIDWSWYINGDTANKVTGGTNESLQGANPTSPSANPPTDTGCQKTNSDSFDLTPLDGKKYKDANGDGLIAGDTGLAGFEVKLFRQNADLSFATTASATGLSACNDDPATTEVFECTEAPFAFTPASLAPGTYKVVETQVTGWRQTLPIPVSGQPGTRTIVISLGETSETVGNWANTPLSSFSMTFTPNATYPAGNGPKTGTAPTAGTIACTNNPGSQTGNVYTATNQQTGTYNCQLVIVDP